MGEKTRRRGGEEGEDEEEMERYPIDRTLWILFFSSVVLLKVHPSLCSSTLHANHPDGESLIPGSARTGVPIMYRYIRPGPYVPGIAPFYCNTRWSSSRRADDRLRIRACL